MFVLVFIFYILVAQAATIPTAGDVVLIYDEADIEQQSKYNFLFTVNNQPTIYTCEANYCSTVPWQAAGTITMTVYKLPDGFPRLVDIVDQTLLQDYVAKAEQTYQLDTIATQWDSANPGRPYQVVQLYPDGTFSLSANNYVKPEINTEQFDTTTGQWWLTWRPIIIISLIALGVVAIGITLWKYRQKHALQ